MSKGLFVGLCGLDVVFYENKPLPKEDLKMKVGDVRSCIGGPAANAAITFSLLGGESVVLTYIGNSAVGKVIKQQMAEYRIKVIDMCNDDDVKNISSIYVNTKDATRTILSGRNPIYNLNDFSAIDEAVKDCDFVLYDGHFSHIDDRLLNVAKAERKDIVIDVGDWKETFDKILRFNPTLICSEVFAKDGLNGIELMNRYHHQRAAITRGKKSVLYKTEDMSAMQEIPTVAVNAIDTLGAGDVFHGAYCHFAYNVGLDFPNALKEATKVAGISTTVRGVVDGVKKYIETI
ncbi:MAG: PfkB family carbohydrate kinase [Christensenellales bacterium]